MSISTTISNQNLKLSANPLVNEKTKLITELSDKIQSTTYGDWRDDLFKNGFVVIKGAISQEKAKEYQERIFDWLRSFNRGLKIEDRSTWRAENLPDHSRINSFSKYCVPHEKVFWDIRMDPGFRKHFAKLWETDELLVSFDALNISFPGREDAPDPGFWPHVDQSPFRTGLSCVQGIANLSEAGEKDGGLVVYKYSNKLLSQFFKEVYGIENWTPVDNVKLKDEHIQWFLEHGAEELKVIAEPGDLILWDSNTVHYGKNPDEDSKNIRTVAYISYTPAAFATDENLKKKQDAFKKWNGTTHWAHDNINIREDPPRLVNGELDPNDRKEPWEKPDLTPDLLKLAGVIPYQA